MLQITKKRQADRKKYGDKSQALQTQTEFLSKSHLGSFYLAKYWDLLNFLSI